MSSLAIIVPTIGRLTLVDTLLSFADDVREGDDVYVISDGPRLGLSLLVGYFNTTRLGNWRYIPHKEEGCWGHPLRNALLGLVDTDYIWTLDDDDEAAPGALDALRSATAPWTIYRMHFGDNHPARGITCWREKQLQHGDIGTPMLLAKPCNARFGLRYEGDYDYMLALNEELGPPAWDERVVAEIRP